MNLKIRSSVLLASVVAVAGAAAMAVAGDDKSMLPPGWTEADMQACMEAGTPGEQHQHLLQSVGAWTGKAKMWMAPGAQPVNTVFTSTVSSEMDGRFTKVVMNGEIPGMGPMSGMGLFGYDNVTGQFQSTWVGTCHTGMMHGTGEMSSDGSTITWVYTGSCPITKKPTTMREIERRIGKDSFTLETHGQDPKTGKEFKMMEVAFTRKAASGATAVAPTNTR